MKQETIKTLGNLIYSRSNCGCKECQNEDEKRIENACAYLAALCKFPEKEINKILQEYAHPKERGIALQRVFAIDDIKRLWPLQDHIVDKKVCQKCGGSEKYCRFDSCVKPAQKQIGCMYCPHYECCPQCDGTGQERRVGEERRERQICPFPKCKYPIAPFPDGEVGHFYFFALHPAKMRIQHTITNRRSGEDQRKVSID